MLKHRFLPPVAFAADPAGAEDKDKQKQEEHASQNHQCDFHGDTSVGYALCASVSLVVIIR